MYLIDILYFLSVVVLPVGGLILSNYISIKNHVHFIVWIGIFFIIHNSFFLGGYSLRGDNIDYILFAIEYPFILWLLINVSTLKKNILTKTLKITGYITLIIILLFGVLTCMFMFIPVNMDYVSDRQTSFSSNNKTYEVRRYCFSFVTLINSKYTFETYRTFNLLPIEKRIDTTVFWDNKTDVNISGNLKFRIVETATQKNLIFYADGKEFTKQLK